MVYRYFKHLLYKYNVNFVQVMLKINIMNIIIQNPY